MSSNFQVMPNWDLISFINRSKYRRKVLKELHSSPNTPTELSKKLSFPRSSVSEALSKLGNKGLIKALTKARKSKYYDITDKGEKILKKLKELEGNHS